MTKKWLFLLLLLFASSCIGANKHWYKPMSWVFDRVPTSGTPGFRLGWMHGCESGLGSQFGGSIYMFFYSWKKDVRMAKPRPNEEDIIGVREDYPEELAGVNWNDRADINKNFNDYRTIFWAAHIYCRHAVVGTLQSADMTPPVASQIRYDPSDSNIGNIYKIDGVGGSQLSHW